MSWSNPPLTLKLASHLQPLIYPISISHLGTPDQVAPQITDVDDRSGLCECKSVDVGSSLSVAEWGFHLLRRRCQSQSQFRGEVCDLRVVVVVIVVGLGMVRGRGRGRRINVFFDILGVRVWIWIREDWG